MTKSYRHQLIYCLLLYVFGALLLFILVGLFPILIAMGWGFVLLSNGEETPFASLGGVGAHLKRGATWLAIALVYLAVPIAVYIPAALMDIV
ncbi:MAG: hypothetical protein AAF125_27240, partial [Chloroflexota bacterium]